MNTSLTPDKDPPFCCDAVLLCAGEGLRFQRSDKAQTTQTQTTKVLTKLLVALGGKPALQHLCETVRNAGFARIAIVLPQNKHADKHADKRASEAIGALAVASLPDSILVEGGERRQDSLLKALEALQTKHESESSNGNGSDDPTNWVMVFDAARPLVSAELIARVTLRAKLCAKQLLLQRSVAACVVPLLPIADSVKRVSEEGRVCGSVARESLRLAQTPQAAPRALLLRLLRERSAVVTDEAQLCLDAGCSVEAVEGEPTAHKITRRADVGLLEGIAALRAEARIPDDPMPEYRSATGFDVHQTRRVEGGTSLRLCGVDVPALFSLEGHSDADVALHALADAVLSLAGAGDIGDLFPPTDERWRNADSALFLARAIELLQEAGGALVSLDITLLLEKPHLGQFKAAMRERLATLSGLTAERVGVKATTLEGLGALGRGEGVGAWATASARFA